jgi:hypothetical protein
LKSIFTPVTIKNVVGVIFFHVGGTKFVYGGHFKTNYI